MIDDEHEQVQGEADVSQHSENRFINESHKDAKQKESANSSSRQQQRSSKTNRYANKGATASQSINSSFYKPSQPHSLPNPKLSRPSTIPALHNNIGNEVVAHRIETA